MLDELTADEEGSNDDDEEREEGAIDDATDEGALDERRLDATDEAAPQIAPVTTGVSTAPLVFTCTPKDTVFPGCTLPFQLKLEAL
jgi:hypothetical protein